MLRITMNKSASGAKKYYSEAYYQEGINTRSDYYSEKGNAIGKWGGKAAAQLGLSGGIDSQDFGKLCDNINPLDGKQLTARNDKDRTVGYDFTFNAPKSVSLVHAFSTGTEKQLLLDAFQQSVSEAMQEIESGMQARVRAKGKNENRITGNIAYGEFTHFTARPVDGLLDPHLHSHCFVLNTTFDGEENKWKAGQFRQIKQDAPYYEAVFHSKLAQRLQALGYGITKTASSFEINGIDKNTLDKFSRRTKEIEDYSREHGITDDSEKSKVGAKTREAKRSHLSGEQQEAEWSGRLSEPEHASLLNAKSTLPRTNGHGQEPAVQALQYSLAHHLERKSVASDKEILATAIWSSIGKATPEGVQQAFQDRKDILSATEDLRTLVTTKEALAEEKRLITQCNASKNKFRPINENYEPQNPLLNDQQKAAVKHALSSTDGITIITGKAGTGKTTLMKEVKQGITEGGKQIFSFAPSSEASRGVQRSEGFDNADTVARLIVDTTLHPELKQQVIWIDEAGMLSNRDMNKILEIANTQSARVILSGDTKQHSSVERGDALRIIQQEAGIKPVTVDKIQRQKDTGYKEAVELLAGGHTEKGFKKLDRIGAIHEMTDGKERIEAVANEYCNSATASKDVLVIAPTHAEGDLVTNKIREQLKSRHLIGEEERQFKIFKNRQLTTAEKQQQESYQHGDWLVYHQNGKGIKAGSRMKVIVSGENGLFARDGSGQPHHVFFGEADRFNVYAQREIGVATGDKIRMTANGKSTDGKHLFNGSTFQVEGFDKEGNIRLSNGSAIPPDHGHFTMGYVSTSHAAQGKTADKVIISQSSATFRASSMEQFYVSVSRGRQAVSIYTDDKEHLLEAVSHSSERVSATELMEKRQGKADEMERMALSKERQARTAPTNDPVTKNNRHDGLQTTARTEQDTACR